MLKNKEIKKLFFTCFILFILAIILCILFSILSFNIYKNELIKNNSKLIGTILENHPNLEKEVIDSLVDNEEKTEYGLSVLQKYGLDDSKYLDYFADNNSLKVNLIIYNIVFTVLILTTFFVICFIFIKKQYQTLNHIDKYMNNILHGDYSLDIRDYCEGDISNLKNDIYKMTVKLKEQNNLLLISKKNLEETLADISHQIKTPLTSMYVINDILIDNELDSKERKEFLTKNKNQLERIEWLVTSLLKISRLDNGSIKLQRDTINIDDLINTAIYPIKILAELKNIDIIFKSVNYNYELDFNWTCEALTNILKNACEHTNNNGKIIIDVKDNPLYLNIIIKDNGVGIKKEDLAHIFERFYKGSQNKDSIGIGLNLSKKIINLQNGEIDCKSTINVGTTFDIKFYKKII